ncbi:MAG: hypothetical protein P8Y98_06705 [Anaerolineales bacterium]|jgi:hypothetical protein
MPSSPLKPYQIRWARYWMTLVFVGFMIFIIGIQPDLIGMNRSEVVGFIQVDVWLVGLAILLASAYACVRVIRNHRPMSLRADIGVRLIATGYVVSAAASLADFIGLGAQHLPYVAFGPIQVIGLATGVAISLLGLLLYWPRNPKPKDASKGRRFPRLKMPRLRIKRIPGNESPDKATDTTPPKTETHRRRFPRLRLPFLRNKQAKHEEADEEKPAPE